jgi:hypothetical protein
MRKTSRRRKDDTWFLSAFHKGEYVTIETFKRRPRSPPDASTVPFQNDGDQDDSPVCKKEKVKTVALVLPHERTAVLVLPDEQAECTDIMIADAAYFAGITDMIGGVAESKPLTPPPAEYAHKTNYTPISYILEDISQETSKDTVEPSQFQTPPPPQCHEEVATVCDSPQGLGMGISGFRNFSTTGLHTNLQSE